MYWENPSWLLAWWLLPVMLALLIVAHRRQHAAALRFADAMMLRRLVPQSRRWRTALKYFAVLAAFGMLVAAAARPRWGVHFETVYSKGVDLYVLLDVSRSMLAEDVTPNRLERAKADIRDLLQKLAGDRVGLIPFAGAPVIKVPLTTDHNFLLNVLGEVDTTTAPRGGSLIGDAIRKALESMENRRDRDQVIVLITDGEDQDSFPEEAAKLAADKGIKIFTVGLGDTSEGRRVPVRGPDGALTYLQYDGREVWSKMDEELLKKIATLTGGAYVPARTLVYDLGEIYEQHLSQLTRGTMAFERRKRYGDRFQIFLAGALALIAIDLAVARYPKPKPDQSGP